MTKKKDNTAVQRGKRYANRQEDRGLVRVHPWVPANRKLDLLNFAQKLRKEEAALVGVPFAVLGGEKTE